MMEISTSKTKLSLFQMILLIVGLLSLLVDCETQFLTEDQFTNVVTPQHDSLILFYTQALDFPTQNYLISSLNQVSESFGQEMNDPIFFGYILIDSFSKFNKYIPPMTNYQIVLFKKVIEDRSCLLSPPPVLSNGILFETPSPSSSSSSQIDCQDNHLIESLVTFVNKNCNRHRLLNGSLTNLGFKIQELENNIHKVSKEETSEHQKCERIKHIPTKKEFFENYLSKSKPVIIEGANSHWESLKKWTNEYLRKEVGEQKVHIKLTPDGEFEGCDDASNWQDFESRTLPEIVRNKIQFPDKVVVRPAPHDISFNHFMDILESSMNISAYLEYTSIEAYLPSLLDDISPFPFVEDVLIQRHLNMWFGNGKTLGKLHFDPFDNLLCQVGGEKHLKLFDPSQSQYLYEGHIPEAILSYSFQNGFSKKTLLESTSMVMSPVDIKKPNYETFPKYEYAKSIECNIKKGEVLYLPSYWWHEVQSKPDENHRNIAVNYWFEPFFDKLFPCQNCSLFVSPNYYHLLNHTVFNQ